MKTLLAAAAVSLCCALPAAAGTLEELTPYFSTQYFTWREHDGGRRILKERGALFSLGVLGTVAESSVTLRGRGELFGGEVGYDGETQAPGSLPIHTEVGYFGTREELDLGYRIGPASRRLEPFGGIGHRWWLRALQDTTSAEGPVSGYTEWWQTVYGRVGARGELEVPRDIRVVVEAGAKYPFYTGNSVNFAGSGVTTFRPGARWSGFAEAGVVYRNLKLALIYEGFRFSRSPQKQVQSTDPLTQEIIQKQYLQPDSSSDIFGVSLGWTFR